MRKMVFALAALLMITVSCKKEETNEGGGTSASIIGLWNGVMNTSEVEIAGSNGMDTSYTEEFPLTGLTANFMSNNTVIISYFGSAIDTSTWSKSGNTLTLDGEEATITKLDANNLHFNYTEIDDVTYAPGVMTYIDELTFTR